MSDVQFIASVLGIWVTVSCLSCGALGAASAYAKRRWVRAVAAEDLRIFILQTEVTTEAESYLTIKPGRDSGLNHPTITDNNQETTS